MNPEIRNFAELERFIKEHPEETEAIEEAYFYLREQHEDEQMQTEGQIDPLKVPVEFLATTALALAFRNRPKIIEEDKDYQKLVKKHEDLWLKKNNRKDFASKEGLDYKYGSLENENAPTLKKDAEQEFRNNPRFKKRAERYDKEKKKVYKKLDEDPSVTNTRREIEDHTSARHAYLKTHEDTKTPEEITSLIQKRSWERFATENPEKAKKYAQINTDIKKALEKQEIKKQLAQIEQKTGRQVRYVEKTHRPQDVTIDEATRRLESIIPTPPRPIPTEHRTFSPQTGRFFDRGGRTISGIGRQFDTRGRQGTRIVTQVGKTIGRIAVRSLFSNPIALLAIGLPVLLIIAVFIIIMLLGGGGGGLLQKGVAKIECVDANGVVVVASGNACAQALAEYYKSEEGIAVTATCREKCTDSSHSLSCDRGGPEISECDIILYNSCGGDKVFCIEYTPPSTGSARLYDCSTPELIGTPLGVNGCGSTPTPTPTPPSAPVEFRMTYQGWSSANNACSQTFQIYGQEPAASGTYPVFVFTHGTLGGQFLYDATEAQLYVNGMAKRGYVAISVQYEATLDAQTMCPRMQQRTQCIYAGTPTSALTMACSRNKADCNKGIVTMGFSQGSYIATLAKNYDSRIKAAYTYGAGALNVNGLDFESCVIPTARSLPSDRLRVVTGESDIFMSGGTMNSIDVRRALESITGSSCGPTAFSCLGQGGSGWYMVADSEVADGEADHFYHMIKTMINSCQNASCFDPAWIPPTTNAWSLKTNLDWLTSF